MAAVSGAGSGETPSIEDIQAKLQEEKRRLADSRLQSAADAAKALSAAIKPPKASGLNED